MDIRPCIKYVGVNDHEIDLFEGQYIVPNGMAYNSYVIVDQKIAVMDTVDACFIDRWLDNIESVLDGRTPDYLVVQHMEPDHSSGIQAFADRYPEAQIVSNAKAFPMMQAFFGEDYASRRVLAADGVTLSLGERTLAFVTAPMVHWPEVILTYIPEEKVLFSADAFGKFGALDVEEEWDCEARRYYIGIVGKYGAQVQAVLKKAAALSIECICPLHGPVLTGDGIKNALEKYQIWSTYAVEDKGVTIAYASIYGHTAAAAIELANTLEEAGVTVEMFDLARDDMAEAVECAFRYDRLVLAASTYNNDVFPFMRTFIDHLTARNFQSRTVAFIENGSWAPAAQKVMRGMLENSKNLTIAQNNVTIKSALNDDSSAALAALAQELMAQ
ncbi:MAG: FprA family A-type flavoprotein [Clostridia bacterium]|nr:FprA family A-type flavoprotein [Clostridia bacterium]